MDSGARSPGPASEPVASEAPASDPVASSPAAERSPSAGAAAPSVARSGFPRLLEQLLTGLCLALALVALKILVEHRAFGEWVTRWSHGLIRERIFAPDEIPVVIVDISELPLVERDGQD